MYLWGLCTSTRNLTVLKYPPMTREKISTSIILKVRHIIKHDRCPHHSTLEDMAKFILTPFALATCKTADVSFNTAFLFPKS